MLEKLQNVRFLLAAMCGLADEAAVKEMLLKQADTTENQMSAREKKEFDELVRQMLNINGVFDEVANLQAALVKKTFDAFVKAGFSPEQALTLTAASKLIPSVELT